MMRKLFLVVMGSWSVLEATESQIVQESMDMWIWIGVFIIALLSVGLLFFASQRKIQKLQAMLDKQLEMEQSQNIILTKMSENIHEIVQRTLANKPKVYPSDMRNKEEMHSAEDRLLGVTNELIDFLRLKSKKVEIKNSMFNLNNVLNELSGEICSKHAGTNIELIFEVNSSVPRHLIGDSLHLGQVLSGIFEHILGTLNNEDELKLEVSMYRTYEDNIQLQFKYRDSGNGLSSKEMESLFIPYYDESTGKYKGLGMYVSIELTKLMGGQLNVQSTLGKGTVFILDIPFKISDPENKRKYRLPSKVLTEKKVFIVDSNYNSALAIKKMFAYFRHDVRVMTKEDFREYAPKLTDYDIVVIHESLFDTRLVRYLYDIKSSKELKVVALDNLIMVGDTRFEDDVIDIHLFKPLNQERVFELIINLYDMNVIPQLMEEEEETLLKAKVYTGDIRETRGVNQESFADFSGKSLLIVEDNFINQKVLVNLLSKSNMHISLASDGEQAVNLVKSSKESFDFILMDINMPVMDGYTATKMIRQDKRFNKIPIVTFTALILESEKKKMFSSGVSAFLAKPLNIGKLYTAFSMYISDDAIKKVKEEKQKAKQMVFDGLHIKEGIAHANNNEALYMELLKEFAEAYGKSDKTLESLIQQKRYEQIKMLCIDLRGLSGAIGALDMQAVINEIHHSILYNKQQLLSNHLARYQREMERVNRAIETYLLAHSMYDDEV